MLSNHARISISIFSTLLVLLSLYFLLLTPHLSLSQHLPFHKPKPATPRPVVTTTFRPIPALEDLSLAADPAWAALLPGDGGFLNVRYNETYVQTWGISAFHALHCLAMIRGALQSASGLRADGGWRYGQGHGHGGGGGDEGVGDHYLAPEHLMHCFSYLAQALQCNGDTTIERPWVAHTVAGDVKASGVDGMGVQHQCRSMELARHVAAMSDREAVEDWGWKVGDTVESVFGV